MAEVEINVNGRRYTLACDDGQEDHLRKLGSYVDGKVQQMADQIGQVGEPRLLVMASLLIADELHEARRGNGAPAGGKDDAEAKAAQALEQAAVRLDDIAQRLEAS